MPELENDLTIELSSPMLDERIKREQKWIGFKKVIGLRDPEFSLNIHGMSGEDAFNAVCERYGLPAKMLWAFVNCDIYEIVEYASRLHWMNTPLKAYETPVLRKILPNDRLPAFSIGLTAEIWGKASDNAGTSFIRVTNKDGSFHVAFIPQEALGDVTKKHRALNLS